MKKIYITVDVECHNLDEENLYIYGKIGDKKYGIEKIMDIGDEFGIPINFFVNLVERHKYPEDYVQRIIDTIKNRNHPIYLHLHPSCIAQDGRPFFWHYSKEEQDKIMKIGFDDYKSYLNKDSVAFRAGSYSADQNMYDSLSKQANNIVDLSYCYDYKKMCHYYPKVINQAHYNNKVFVLPNTRYRSLDFLGKRKYNNLDVNSSFYAEMKDIIKTNPLNHLVCTMHSWNLVNSWFYKGKTMKPHRRNIRKMKKLIKFAQANGYEFSSFDNFDYLIDEKDYDFNLCKGFFKKIRGLIFSFFRMQRVAKSNKKYLKIYSLFYGLLFALLAGIIVLIILLNI